MKPQSWGDDDSVIACRRVGLLHGKIIGFLIDIKVLRCELCDWEIYAASVSAEKQGQSGWHLICRECVNTIGEPMKFGGRIHAEDREIPNA